MTVLEKKEIAQISGYLLDGNIVISLDPKWLEVFGGIPRFTVMIDEDSRLVLIGPVIPNSKRNLKRDVK